MCTNRIADRDVTLKGFEHMVRTKWAYTGPTDFTQKRLGQIVGACRAHSKRIVGPSKQKPSA